MLFFKFLIAYFIAIFLIWGFFHSSSRLSKREEELMMREDSKK